MLRYVLEAKEECCSVIISKPKRGPQQLWEFEEDGTIRSKLGRVLDVYEIKTEPGTPVIAYPKNGGWNQNFRFIPISE